MFIAALQSALDAAASVPAQTLETVSTGGQIGLWGGLLWVTNRVVGPLVDLAKDAKAYIEALGKELEDEKTHRVAQIDHWMKVEELLAIQRRGNLVVVPEDNSDRIILGDG